MERLVRFVKGGASSRSFGDLLRGRRALSLRLLITRLDRGDARALRAWRAFQLFLQQREETYELRTAVEFLRRFQGHRAGTGHRALLSSCGAGSERVAACVLARCAVDVWTADSLALVTALGDGAFNLVTREFSGAAFASSPEYAQYAAGATARHVAGRAPARDIGATGWQWDWDDPLQLGQFVRWMRRVSRRLESERFVRLVHFVVDCRRLTRKVSRAEFGKAETLRMQVG